MRAAPRWSVQLVKVGESEVRGPEAYWMDRWDEWVTLFFYVVLLRGGGRTVLLNAGPPEDLSAINAAWAGYLGGERGALRVADNERLPAALAAHGVAPGEVDTVLLTPLTAYTTGRLELFERAEICIGRTAWIDLHAPPAGANPATARSIAIHEPALVRLVTDWWPRVRLLGDEDEVAPGITVFRAGVHQKGTLAVGVATERGTVVYSDAAYRRGNVESMHPIGLARSIDEAYESYARIARTADLFLPAFEPGLLDEYPSGEVTAGRESADP
jgi:hypothetical protein